MNIAKLQKQACSKKLWAMMGADYVERDGFGACLRWAAECTSIDVMSLAAEAKDLLERIEDAISYGKKLPRQPWSVVEPLWLTLDQARAAIEHEYRAGYSNEPYVQLIKITDNAAEVVAEWTQQGWLDPLVAAGFAPRSI